MKIRAPRRSVRRPVQDYLNTDGHLADTGGAYLVLPYTLLDQLPADRAAAVTAAAEQLSATNPGWRRDTCYQVLSWARIRPATLSADELADYGITATVDPATNTVTYTRGTDGLPADTVIDHRPTADPIPAPPGARPGARPPMLAIARPGSPGGAVAFVQPAFRAARAARLAEIGHRRATLAQATPTGDPRWLDAVAAADDLWGPGQDWRLIAQATTPAAEPGTEPATGADQTDDSDDDTEGRVTEDDRVFRPVRSI